MPPFQKTVAEHYISPPCMYDHLSVCLYNKKDPNMTFVLNIDKVILWKGSETVIAARLHDFV